VVVQRLRAVNACKGYVGSTRRDKRKISQHITFAEIYSCTRIFYATDKGASDITNVVATRCDIFLGHPMKVKSLPSLFPVVNVFFTQNATCDTRPQKGTTFTRPLLKPGKETSCESAAHIQRHLIEQRLSNGGTRTSLGRGAPGATEIFISVFNNEILAYSSNCVHDYSQGIFDRQNITRRVHH